MKIAILILLVFISVPLAVAGDEELSKRVDLLLEQLQTGDISVSRSASIALQALGEDGRQILLSRLDAEHPLTRVNAILGLEAMGERSSTGAVIELVDDPDPGVRSAAIRALGRLKAEEAFQPILGHLDDPDHGVRANAVGALANLGSRQAIKPVILLATDPSADVRRAVAYAIGRLGGRSASALLCLKALLKDGEGKVRRNAAISLGEVGNQLVEKDLLLALSDEDPWVRSASARALGRLMAVPEPSKAAPGGACAELHPSARDKALCGLRSLLKDEKSQVRASAAETLGELADEGSVESLAGLLDDEGPSGIYLYSSMRELSIAEVAAISLARITGDNLGYERELPEEKREEALERWRAWRKTTVKSPRFKVTIRK